MPPADENPIGVVLYYFLSILFEGVPYILIGTFISGVIDAYVPAGLISKYLPKNRMGSVMLGGLMGAIFPVCECAVVPVIRRLVGKGLPVSCAITYMLAAPIVNPITAISTWSAFDGQDQGFVTFSRIFLAYVIAVGAGLLLGKLPLAQLFRPSVARSVKKAEEEPISLNPSLINHDARWVAAMRTTMRDFLDVCCYFVIGAALAAIFNAKVDQAVLKDLAGNDLLATPAMMVFAFVLALCSTSDAFVAASLKSFSTIAKLGFLIFGPMMDVKLIALYSTVFRPRVVLGMAVGLFIAIAAILVPWSQVQEQFTNTSTQGSRPSIFKPGGNTGINSSSYQPIDGEDSAAPSQTQPSIVEELQPQNSKVDSVDQQVEDTQIESAGEDLTDDRNRPARADDVPP